MLYAMRNDPMKIGRRMDSKDHFLILYSVVLAGESGHGGAPPLLHHLHLSARVLERASAHGGMPPSRTNSTSSPPYGEPSNSCYLLPPGSARRAESTSDSDPKWSPYLLVPRRLPWKIQSGLPNPSLWKRARAPPVRSPLAFSRSLLETLLSGFLLLFLILDDAHLAQIHPWISSLSRLTGCASNPTPLGALPLVVWLGLTTSWRRTTERKLRGFWGGCDGKFHLFHQVLGWSSCLRSPTNRHAVVRLGSCVSPDFWLHFMFLVHHYVDCVAYPYQCTLRLWYLHDKCAADGRTNRLYPPGSRSVTHLDLGVN